MATPFTINQRVRMLTNHGLSHETIAATLNITVAQVATILATPATVVADPYEPAA